MHSQKNSLLLSNVIFSIQPGKTMFPLKYSKFSRILFPLMGLMIYPGSISLVAAENTASVSIESLHVSLKPYRIRIDIAYAPNARLSPLNKSRIQNQLLQKIERSVGEKWILTEKQSSQTKPDSLIGIYENDWLPLPSQVGLQRVNTKEILKRFPDQSFDKLYLIAIESAGIGYCISGREFDRLSRKLSPLIKTETFETSFLSGTVFQTINDLFSPIVTVEAVNDNQVTVAEQGSQYLSPDPTVATLAKGYFFVPFLRYLNREREVKNIQMIPWTYIVLEELNRKYATCSISSGLRGILSGSRRRVETLAIRVKPEFSNTRLSLIPRGSSTQSYAGMQVEISPLNPQEVRQKQIAAKKLKDESKKPPAQPVDYITGQFLTNRSGTISLKPDPKHPLIWLYIRSGKALVANVPYIPGIDRSIAIQIPDDRIRLNVEGELEILNGELIEEVASLSMKKSRIRGLAKRNDWKKVDDELRKLESAISPKQIFQNKLNLIQVTALEKAQKQFNKSAQSRILRLCRDTSDRIDRFLDPSGIIDLKTELQDLKALQKSDPQR